MTDFAVSVFPDRTGATLRRQRMSLDALAELVRETAAPCKDQLPLLSLATFGDQRSRLNSLRHNVNVQKVGGIVVDYDGMAVELDTAIETLDKAGIVALGYTSPSCRPGAPRWRLVCPFSDEHDPAVYYQMVSRLNGLLGGILAPESWTLSLSYYFGHAADAAEFRIEVVDGMTTIDRADELDETAIGKPNGAANGQWQGGEPTADIDDVRAALDIIPNSDRDWNDWSRIGMAVWRSTGGSEEGYDAFANWSRKSAKHDAGETRSRWQHWGNSPPDKLGFGTLVFEARLIVPTWLPPSRRPRSRTGDVPMIEVVSGGALQAAEQGVAALVDNNAELFRRDDRLVYVLRVPMRAADGHETLVPSFRPVTMPALRSEMERAAVWQRYDGRRKRMVHIDAPADVASRIMTDPNAWPFPAPSGIIATPTLRPDGTLLSAPGFDRATGFVLFDPVAMPPIPDQPGYSDAMRALHLLEDLLAEFPFAGNKEVSRAVALSALMTPTLRPALAPAAPLHVANAPKGGTGKSYLADLASAIASGDACPALGVSKSAEETEKRLVGAALAGQPIISVDNCNGLLQSEFLCQAVERPLIQLRPLGTSDQFKVPNGVTVFANGNNIEIAEDLVRRSLRSDLDRDIEHPERHVFKGNPLAAILADRGRYVAAILTIARAYIVAGMPGCPAPLLSFGGWSDRVRAPLIWLGCADPADSVEELHAVDPIAERRAAVFAAIAALPAAEQGHTVGDLVKMAGANEGLRSALVTVAGKDDGSIDGSKLGYWFRRNRNRREGGLKLMQDDAGSRLKWIVMH